MGDSRTNPKKTPRYLDNFSATFAHVVEGKQNSEENLTKKTKIIPALASATNSSNNVVVVNRAQKGNPLLSYLTNVSLNFEPDNCEEKMKVDYLINNTTGVVFLSLRYHLLHPKYLEHKLIVTCKNIQQTYRSLVLLVHVDMEDNITALRKINHLALQTQFSLLLGFSWQETARYLEVLKSYQAKSASLLQGPKISPTDHLAMATQFLTSNVPRINKTDVGTLLGTFGSIKEIGGASMEELALCPGIGEKKIKQLYDIFNQPFH